MSFDEELAAAKAAYDEDLQRAGELDPEQLDYLARLHEIVDPLDSVDCDHEVRPGVFR